MTVEQVVFYILTIFVIGGGLGVAATNNLYYSALFLTTSLAGMAGFFVLLSAGFLAAVQVIVYIGAIAILILFAIMLSRNLMTTGEPQSNDQIALGSVVAVLLYGALTYVVSRVEWPLSGDAPAQDMIERLGVGFLGSYLIPFEVVSVLLLVALVGGIILAREVEPEESE